jgi:hypothetical protein
LRVVDFPAPFGPRKAQIEPAATSKVKSSVSVRGNHLFDRWIW